MKFKIFFIISILIKSIELQQQFLNVCQSGIREDNTNYIYCARRGLTDVPLFSKNNVVYDELVLADNKITQLNANSFNRIKVKKIYLNGNPLRSIELTTFQKLENHLEELWLDGEYESDDINSDIDVRNRLVGVPKAIVNYLRNLNKLRLKGLYAKSLENFTFKRLNRIEILSLQFCSIEKIEPNAFDGLHNSLKELYLDGNQLQFIPTDALLNGAFKQLKVLSISQNNIKTIGLDSFGFINFGLQLQNNQNQPLSTLNKLDLSYNGLKQIDSMAFNNFNSSLETLLLQNNEINSYNLKFMRQLTTLKDLNLDFNLITKFSLNLFSNSQKLQYLSLQGNSISFDLSDGTDASTIFDGLTGLQRLNLARNGLKHVPNRLFLPMKQLKSLILDKNLIDNLNELTFEGLFHSLMNISMQYTKFKSKNLISLKHMERLERVKLGFNDLDTLDWSILDKMSSTLSNLDLQNNKIEQIILNANNNLKMENLQDLDLSNNKLCNLGITLLEKTPKLKNLGLSQNPLYCDCHLLPLYEWTRRKFDKDMLSYTQWQCELPVQDDYDYSKTIKRKFTTLSPSDLVCSNFTETASKCLIKSSSISKQQPNQISIKMTQSPLRQGVISTSFMSTIPKLNDYYNDVEPSINSPVNTKQITRISNIQLSNKQNSIEIDWELDNQNDLNDIKGFKISYNQANDNNLTTTFLTDKYQRNFKLDNLIPNKRYTCCVSILRSQGYDKYCKEIDLILTNSNQNEEFIKKVQTTKKQIKTVNTTSLSSIISNTEQNTASLSSSNVLSGLMITVLVILICFIVALLVFIYVYIRKCRLNKKLMKSKSIMNNTSTLNSRRNYSGGILTSTTLGGSGSNRHHLEHAILNNHQLIQANPCLCCNVYDPSHTLHVGNNCIKLAMGGSSNQNQAQQNGETSSTVSSTLSSVANTSGNPNGNNNNNLYHQTCMLFEQNDALTISPNNNNNINNVNKVIQSGDLMASSPSSFTHFKPVSYLPYEVYNNNNTSTLILPIHNQQALKQAYLTLSQNNNNSNNKMIKVNQYGFIATGDGNTNNDHVYCEIPYQSTMSKQSYRQQQNHILVFNSNNGDTQNLLNNNRFMASINNNNNNTNLNSYDQILMNENNSNNMNNNHQRYSQQNSSASLLLSTTSSSSASTTPSTSSPKNPTTGNFNNLINSNKLTASII